jgi:hypothetical protein
MTTMHAQTRAACELFQAIFANLPAPQPTQAHACRSINSVNAGRSFGPAKSCRPACHIDLTDGVKNAGPVVLDCVIRIVETLSRKA